MRNFKYPAHKTSDFKAAGKGSNPQGNKRRNVSDVQQQPGEKHTGDSR